VPIRRKTCKGDITSAANRFRVNPQVRINTAHQKESQAMKWKKRKLSALVALCTVLSAADGSLLGQKPRPRPQDTIGPSGGQVTAAIAGIVGVSVALGVGITLAVKHNNHSVTGCARSGPDGMTLTTESDKQTYSLLGEVAGIKPGERVRVSGKKGKSKSGTHEFLVEKVSKDLGACEASSALH
jgi:hypothetical protein